MTKPSVLYETRDRVGYVTLNRPDALNAIDESILSALPGVLASAAADPAVKALTITGNGDVFSVGLDIGLLGRAFDDLAYFRNVLGRFKKLLLDIEAIPLPVVAAVNGLARAGGFEIAIACDLVLVADEARFGDTHLAYGIVPGGGATQRLPRLIGRQRAREIIFSGRWMKGPEVVANGLALRSLPRTELPSAVEEMVAVFRTRSRPCLAATKAAMREGESLPLDEALDVEIDHFIRYLETEPTSREGFRASVERREPVWP
ncbi:MAG: enoyl-CoA hydratase/isomerase family protein [Actinomycetota bacterium]|nr:enoyl-CoA hydratase/isomerase family protein [Actinomycetota bacterium]